MPEAYVPFERLTWTDGERQVVPPPPQTAEEEAEAILMALGGFSCTKCDKPLSASAGFSCCNHIYCPICGKDAGQIGTYHDWHCPHLVMRRHGFTLYFVMRRHGFTLYFEAVSSATDIDRAVRSRVKQALKFALPARRLKGQKTPGFPSWSDGQIDDAYGISPRVIKQLFGPRLLSPPSTQALNTILLGACLRPERQTNILSGNRHDEYYFSDDSDSALQRLIVWAEAIATGTERLRALPPVRYETG